MVDEVVVTWLDGAESRVAAVAADRAIVVEP
jgi:hypothetical protein